MLLVLASATEAAAAEGRDATACSKEAATNADLGRGTASLLSLERVRQWERQLPRDVHMAAIPGETAVALDGECYGEVTLYESHSDHMYLWHSFLIGNKIIKIENIEGDWVSIEDDGSW